MASKGKSPKSESSIEQSVPNILNSIMKIAPLLLLTVVLALAVVLVLISIVWDKNIKIGRDGITITTSDTRSASSSKENIIPPLLVNPTEPHPTWQELYSKLRALQELHVEYRKSIWYGFGVILTEIAQKGSINTKLPANDDRTIEVYQCIQRCLGAIGYFKGTEDGNQDSTQDALEEFQDAMHIEKDAKLGRKTFLALLDKFLDVI